MPDLKKAGDALDAAKNDLQAFGDEAQAAFTGHCPFEVMSFS